MSLTIKWVPSGRGKPRCDPDPEYPNGIAVDTTNPGEASCIADLPYPAPECGMYVIACDECGMTIAITAAGRPDDPVSVRFPCRKEARSTNQN